MVLKNNVCVNSDSVCQQIGQEGNQIGNKGAEQNYGQSAEHEGDTVLGDAEDRLSGNGGAHKQVGAEGRSQGAYDQIGTHDDAELGDGNTALPNQRKHQWGEDNDTGAGLHEAAGHQ